MEHLYTSHAQKLHAPSVADHKGNPSYRRAILQALEELRDFQSRSNVDLIRRRTKDLIEADDDHHWNENVFLQTLKAVVRGGEVTQQSHIYAELSPQYKRKRANSLTQFMQAHQGQEDVVIPELPMDDDIVITPAVDNVAPLLPHHVRHLAAVSTKMLPATHHDEHEKWKIMPKAIYDKTL